MIHVKFSGFLTAATVLLASVPAYAQFNIDFMAAPIAFDSETVTGAPYSAEAVTEVVQTLADGNRIIRQSKAEISRDGVGRTRREQGLSMIGPVVGGPDDGPRVQITDPQAGTMILLNMRDRTAHTMPAPRIRLMNGHVGIAAETADTTFEIAVPPDPSQGLDRIQMIYSSRSAIAAPVAPTAAEALGQQFMEGVEVEGSRTTLTIPAGQIGNELPIDVVSERWYSRELKVLVMSRQSDPRFGETTYRLTNITRGEPSPDLFVVPADFSTVKPDVQNDVIIRRKMGK
jgi:hypothetical protein